VCPKEIWWVSLRYMVGFLVLFDGVLEIFEKCAGDIWWVSWRYLIGVILIFDGCLGDI